MALNVSEELAMKMTLKTQEERHGQEGSHRMKNWKALLSLCLRVVLFHAAPWRRLSLLSHGGAGGVCPYMHIEPLHPLWLWLVIHSCSKMWEAPRSCG